MCVPLLVAESGLFTLNLVKLVFPLRPLRHVEHGQGLSLLPLVPLVCGGTPLTAEPLGAHRAWGGLLPRCGCVRSWPLTLLLFLNHSGHNIGHGEGFSPGVCPIRHDPRLAREPLGQNEH